MEDLKTIIGMVIEDYATKMVLKNSQWPGCPECFTLKEKDGPGEHAAWKCPKCGNRWWEARAEPI